MSQFIEMFYNEKYPLQKLKTHIDVIRGVSYKPVDIKEETSDSISVILRSNNISNGQIIFDDVVYVDNKRVTTEQVLSKGDIVMCGSNGSKKLVGKAAMINTIPSYRTSFGAFCLGIRCKESILPEYLSVYFQTPKYREVIEFLGSGSNILNIKPEHIYNLEIPIPSLEDQTHFVTIAEQADKSGFDGFKSQFIEMFGQLHNNTKMNRIVKLAECCSYISDGSHYSPKESVNGAYPMLSVKDMEESGFSYTDCKFIDYDEYIKLVKNGCKPEVGDVLVAKDGSYFKSSFVIKEDKEQTILSSIAILRPDTSKIEPQYLAYYMLTQDVIDIVEQNYLTGTAIRRVILKGFKEIPVLLPSLEDQERFISILQQADKSGYYNQVA